jgi:hypothetical protein
MRLLLPSGSYNFNEIISKNYLYVDKTQYIYNMLKGIQGNERLFLCRPRRFGKSLLLDTMSCLFSGQEELFNGLWLGSSDWPFEKYPVINLNMNFAKSDSANGVKQNIIKLLKPITNLYGLSIQEESVALYAKSLCEGIYNKTGKNIVILIDEYDAPLLRSLSNPTLCLEIVEVLHDFFGAIKDLDSYVRFVFVTGLTQMARTAIGPSASNILDVSLESEFSAVCGFTVEELDQYFGPYYEEALSTLTRRGKLPEGATASDLRGLLLEWYDGYNFSFRPEDGQRVLNPLSVTSFFRTGRFEDYWVQSGPPAFLAGEIRKSPRAFFIASGASPEAREYTGGVLRRLPIDYEDPVPLLFQLGYLTLDESAFKSPPGGTEDYSRASRRPTSRSPRLGGRNCTRT